MEYNNDFKKKVEEAKRTIAEMIANANKQGARNFDMFYILHDGLDELSLIINNTQKAGPEFLKKWDSVMGWVPKVFEDHPLLDSLRDIDEVIVSDE